MIESNQILVWMKAAGKLSDLNSTHQSVAAFCSDFELLNASLAPFGLHTITEERLKTVTMISSLDHSIWCIKIFTI